MIYIEYGIDFDNNRFGLGRSVEIEMPDGTERRCKTKVKLKDKAYYFRLWIGWRVLVVSKKGVEWCKKSRPNFKLVFGVKGQDKSLPAEWIDPTYKNQALLIPESCFGVDATGLDIHLSSEHADFKWLPYHTAVILYRYDLHKIALWELNRRLQSTPSKGAQQ